MPRKARIDFPGALHHIVIRGISRADIFRDDRDRRDFLRRLKCGLGKKSILCYSWALIPNHIHLLMKTGSTPLTVLMRSLLTGYAVYFNKRHNRAGYVFQNRYRSILCDSEAYLMELIRYIHLNPLRAGLVSTYEELSYFPFCGHSVLLGYVNADWQETAEILRRFGHALSSARKAYYQFVREGIGKGSRPELVGGGLVRSVGGWKMVGRLRKQGERWRGDERILGNDRFVTRVLRRTDERLLRKEERRVFGWTLDALEIEAGRVVGLAGESVRSRSKSPNVSLARAIFCAWAIEKIGYRQADISRFLGISQPATAKAAKRGRAELYRGKIKLPERPRNGRKL